MAELEEKFIELQGQYSDLTQSYKDLQLEYSIVKQEVEILKQELETIRQENSEHKSMSLATKTCYSRTREWEKSCFEMFDLSLFDVSTFCYN